MPDLYPYQRDGVHFIHACVAAHGAALLADQMGVGKTPQFLMAPPPGAPVIVSVPALLKVQTAERIAQWRGTSSRIRVQDGLGSFDPPRPGEWLVLNPDVLPATPGEVRAADDDVEAAADQALGDLPLDMGQSIDAAAATRRRERVIARGVLERGMLAPGTWLLVDECDEFNTAQSSQTKRMRGLVRLCRASSGGVVAATATPLRNDPSDLRSLLATFGLGGAAWPSKQGRALDYWGYLRDWGGAKGRFGEEWSGEPRDEAIAAALRRVMLRRLLRDVVDLPPMLPTRTIRVDLDASTRALADAADEMIRTRIRDLDRGGTKIVFEQASKVRAALAVAKLPAAHDWCDEQERAGEPAVVACVSVDTVKEIGKRLGWACIRGGVGTDERAEIVRRFQRGELAGVAMTHAAGGVGIDLFRAARLLVVSREWNPARNRQTLARLVRQGQERRVELSVLMADHVVESRLDELMGRRKRYGQSIDAAAVPGGVAA